jgi:hypothetical protein
VVPFCETNPILLTFQAVNEYDDVERNEKVSCVLDVDDECGFPEVQSTRKASKIATTRPLVTANRRPAPR